MAIVKREARARRKWLQQIKTPTGAAEIPDLMCGYVFAFYCCSQSLDKFFPGQYRLTYGDLISSPFGLIVANSTNVSVYRRSGLLPEIEH